MWRPFTLLCWTVYSSLKWYTIVTIFPLHWLLFPFFRRLKALCWSKMVFRSKIPVNVCQLDQKSYMFFFILSENLDTLAYYNQPLSSCQYYAKMAIIDTRGNPFSAGKNMHWNNKCIYYAPWKALKYITYTVRIYSFIIPELHKSHFRYYHK